MGNTDTHQALEVILEQTGLMEPAFQIAMINEMLNSAIGRVRDIAAIMIFHPIRDVRIAVAALLAQAKGESISPETLRRLIIARNWFLQISVRSWMRPSQMPAVERWSARRLKGEFSIQFSPPPLMVQAPSHSGSLSARKTVSNSAISSGNRGSGSWIPFIHPLPSAKGVDRFLAGLPDVMCFASVDLDYIDRALGYALAAGTSHGGAPHRGLLQIAELLGTDHWQAKPLDPLKELAALRQELQHNDSQLLSAEAVAKALDESAFWPAGQDLPIHGSRTTCRWTRWCLTP